MADVCHRKYIDVLDLWRSANAVCFDVDSTVCLDEGIDELAEYCGAGKAVAEWTSRLDFSHFIIIISISLVLVPISDFGFGFC